MKMVYAGGMSSQPDLHHDINSHLASLKADLFLLERDLEKITPKAQQRLQRLDEHLDMLHRLIKTLFHDVAKTSD